MRKSIYFIFIFILFFQSCKILHINQCKNYSSDAKAFRVTSEAFGSTPELAEEKALFLAKKAIAEEVDSYIVNKCDHKSFLKDSEYENKIMTARKTALSNIKIICSKTQVKNNNSIKSYVSIEILKVDIDKELNKLK